MLQGKYYYKKCEKDKLNKDEEDKSIVLNKRLVHAEALTLLRDVLNDIIAEVYGEDDLDQVFHEKEFYGN